MTLQEIIDYQTIVTKKFETAKTDEDWREFNRMWIELGNKIQQYGGRELYNRERTLATIFSKKSYRG